MIKVEINDNNVNIKAGGTGLETVMEATIAAHEIYEMLCERHELFGMMFLKGFEELCHAKLNIPKEEPKDNADDSDEKTAVELMDMMLDMLKESNNKGENK